MDNLMTIVENNNNLPDITLNFDALREEGTAYLAQLGHHLWTDFNTHDPGITILEVLCFAINDLAYRTSLPIEDLLSHPQGAEVAPQFFTSAEILTCCPVTPLDFRKLMIDCEGVKNAWLFKANAVDQSYYKQYFINKTVQEIEEIICIFGRVKEVFTENTFPVTNSYETFIEALSGFDINTGNTEICPNLPIPGNYGEHIFHFLTKKIEACSIVPNLAVIQSVFSLIADATINLSTVDDEYFDLPSILIYYHLMLTRGEEVGIDTSQLVEFVGNPMGIIEGTNTTEATSEIFRNFRNNILLTTNQACIRDQIRKILALITYDKTSNVWSLNQDNLNEVDRIIQLNVFMGHLINLQFDYYTNGYNINTCADAVGLEVGIAETLLQTMGDFAKMSRLNILLTFINSPEDLIDPPAEEETSVLVNWLIANGYNPTAFEAQIALLSFLDEINLAPIKRFVAKFLEQTPLFNLSDLDFQTLLVLEEEEVITDEHLINLLSKLTKETTENSYFISLDIETIEANLTDRCNANIANIQTFLTLLSEYQSRDANFPVIPNDFIIPAATLVEMLTETGLLPYQNEVLNTIGATPFPIIQLCSSDEIQTAINYLSSVNTQIAEETLNPNLSLDEITRVLNALRNEEVVYPIKLVDTFIKNCISWRIVYCEDDEVPTTAESKLLNGLYTICLDLESNISADDIIAIDEIKANVFNKLCAYRNLGEDFHAIDVVGEKPVCIDLSIVAEDRANVNQLEAEVYYKIQEFLNICPQFHSLQELLDQGLNCDEIYQSIILQNGFLLDDEVEAAKLRRVIYKSDLYQEIMDIEGVKAIKCLRISLCKEADQACAYDNKWCLDICQKEQAVADEALAGDNGEQIEKYTAKITCKYKPILDINASSVCIQKGRIVIPTNAREVGEKLTLLTQINRRPPVNAVRDTPVPRGSYRGLDEYASIQEDFPFVYRVGKGQLANSLAPERKAQIKQLKAYLTFFDQLLANYLAQLDEVKNTLSTCPTPDDRGLFFDSLRGLDPGIDALLRDQYQMNDALMGQLASILEEEEIGLLSPLNGQMPMEYATFLQHIQNLLNREHLGENIIQIIRTHGRIQGSYESQLGDIIENDLERFNRRNKILDHLIARFGEQFTDYALSLYPVCPDDSCKTTQIRLKDSLLRCKTDFLKSIPALGRERGKGMNYKGDDCIKKELFWNSSNVTGMQKRVSKLLCLEQQERIQLSCQPKVTVVKLVDEGRRCFNWALVEEGQRAGSPDVTIYLQGMKEYTLRAKGKRELESIRRNLFDANQTVRIGAEDRLQLDVVQNNDNGTYALVLYDKTGREIAKSQSFTTQEEADSLRDELMELIFPTQCEEEGFHVIEHILLRPFQKELPSLLPICPQARCRINDAYSFWITVVAPAGWKRFAPENGGRTFFEQVVREQTPAHIGICFLWLEGEDLYHLELAYKNWLYDLARQGADDCEIEESLGDFVNILNDLLTKKCLEEEAIEETACVC